MLRGRRGFPPAALTLQLAVPRNPLAGSVRRGEKAEQEQAVTMRLLCTERPVLLRFSVNHGHSTPAPAPLPAFNLDETHKHMRLTSFGVNLMWRRQSRVDDDSTVDSNTPAAPDFQTFRQTTLSRGLMRLLTLAN